MIALIAHTIPAVKTPSKNIDGIQCKPNTRVHSPPKHMDKKNPTQVPVQSVQLMSSPRNDE